MAQVTRWVQATSGIYGYSAPPKSTSEMEAVTLTENRTDFCAKGQNAAVRVISYRAPVTLLARMSADQRWLHDAPKEEWLASP